MLSLAKIIAIIGFVLGQVVWINWERRLMSAQLRISPNWISTIYFHYSDVKLQKFWTGYLELCLKIQK